MPQLKNAFGRSPPRTRAVLCPLREQGLAMVVKLASACRRLPAEDPSSSEPGWTNSFSGLPWRKSCPMASRDEDPSSSGLPAAVLLFNARLVRNRVRRLVPRRLFVNTVYTVCYYLSSSVLFSSIKNLTNKFWNLKIQNIHHDFSSRTPLTGAATRLFVFAMFTALILICLFGCICGVT